MALQITQMLVPASKYGIKCPYAMDPEGVTIHETGNKVSAMSEISYMIGNNYEVSYHFAVDDKRAVQGLPLNRNGWHAGDKANGRGNRKTIGVEHCYNWNGVRTTKNDSVYNPLYQESLKNGIELVANLFIQFPSWGVPEHGKNIWRHYDHSRKNCPQRLIEEGKWLDYVARVKARYLELKGGTATKPTVSGAKSYKLVTTVNGYINAADARNKKNAKTKVKAGNYTVFSEANGMINVTTKSGVPGSWINPSENKAPASVSKPSASNQSGIVKSYKEDGIFYTDPRPDDRIYVRDQPSTKGKVVAEYYTYGVNESLPVEYHTVHLGNGYVWLQYDRKRDGKVIGQGYIPCREYKNGKPQTLWGTIK